MQQANRQQPLQTPSILGADRVERGAGCAPGSCLQREAGAEQEGEHRIEFLLRKRGHEQQRQLVGASQRPGRGVAVQRVAVHERPHVHQQNAEDGEAAQCVDAARARGHYWRIQSRSS